jgi:hypothetical protein
MSGRMFAIATLLTLVNQVSGTPYVSGGDSPDDLFNENTDLVYVLAKLRTQWGTAGQFEQCCADRRGDGVQTGQDEHVTEPERLSVVERVIAHEHLRQDVGAGVLPVLRDGLVEIGRQLDRRVRSAPS